MFYCHAPCNSFPLNSCYDVLHYFCYCFCIFPRRPGCLNNNRIFGKWDYVVTTVFESTIQFRTGKTGYKTSTYYNGSGTKIFDVTVTGTFNYSYGSKASATSASASVNIYNSGASFISKNAYTSSNSAVGLGQVRYGGAPINRSVILKCDVYGNLY